MKNYPKYILPFSLIKLSTNVEKLADDVSKQCVS